MFTRIFVLRFLKITFLLCALCLVGCVPVLLVTAGATAGGAIVSENRSVNTILQDRRITSVALSKINHDPQLREARIHVTIATMNHVMLVAGQAPSYAIRDRIYQVAASVPEVKMLYKEVAIQAPTTQSIRTGDTWITTKVKGALLTQKDLRSAQIKVVTENSVVYLMGLIVRRQADLAANVASTVSGVRQVVRLFEYE